MMMKMLVEGGMAPLTDHIREPDKDNPKGYYEFERVKKLKENDTAWLEDARGKVVKIISALLMELPPDHAYRVVFMRRAMPEILASQRKMLFRRGEDPDKVSDADLARMYEKHLAQVDDWLRHQPNVSVLYVNYNALLDDPYPYLYELDRFLPNALEIEKMSDVVDPTLYRQRHDTGKG